MRKVVKSEEAVGLLYKAIEMLKGTPKAPPKTRALMALRVTVTFESAAYIRAKGAILLTKEAGTAEECLKGAIDFLTRARTLLEEPSSSTRSLPKPPRPVKNRKRKSKSK